MKVMGKPTRTGTLGQTRVMGAGRGGGRSTRAPLALRLSCLSLQGTRKDPRGGSVAADRPGSGAHVSREEQAQSRGSKEQELGRRRCKRCVGGNHKCARLARAALHFGKQQDFGVKH